MAAAVMPSRRDAAATCNTIRTRDEERRVRKCGEEGKGRKNKRKHEKERKSKRKSE